MEVQNLNQKITIIPKSLSSIQFARKLNNIMLWIISSSEVGTSLDWLKGVNIKR